MSEPQTPLPVVPEVSAGIELVDGDDDLAPTTLSKSSVDADELTDNFTASLLDSNTLLPVVTVVSSELVDAADNLVTGVLNTAGLDDVELIDDLTALMTGADTTLAAATEVNSSTELVDDDDLGTDVLGKAGE